MRVPAPARDEGAIASASPLHLEMRIRSPPTFIFAPTPTRVNHARVCPRGGRVARGRPRINLSRIRVDDEVMRKVVLALALSSVSNSVGCGRSDIATDPGDGMFARELTLADGDIVLISVLVADEPELRETVRAMPDGLTLERLIFVLAMGEDAMLVLDTTDVPVLIVEGDGEPRAWIWQ